MSGQQSAITLKEILLSISSSLNDAQEQLRNMQPYDQFGRANILYTLPYLDFNLEVEAQVENTTQTNATVSEATMGSRNYFGNGIYGTLMTYRPVNKKTSSTDTNKITSSISGRFVATPPNEGLPQIYLQETIKQTGNQRKIKILVGNSAGEKIPGAKVEINFIPEESDAVSSIPSLSAAEVYTSNIDGEDYGSAETIITLDNSHANKHIVYEINVGPISKLISIN